jgi:soluble lytic murein transglycosylase-like protein
VVRVDLIMDRVWLIVLALAGFVVTGLPTVDAPVTMAGRSDPREPGTMTAGPHGPESQPDTPRMEHSTPDTAHIEAPQDEAPEAEASEVREETAVDLVLDRLAMRHTALSARERLALAETIVREARLHDLDPDLVMGVIEVESAGYPLAVSHVGAMGLMQLLPSTGEELAGKLGIEWMGPDTLFDPQVNVRLGTAYLRQLSDKYDGNVNIALAAYNWGPGRIDRRLRRGASVPSRYIEQVRSAVDRYASIVPTRS